VQTKPRLEALREGELVRNWLPVLVGVGLAACAGGASPGPSGPLAGSLEVQVLGDTVWLGLHVTNTSGAPLELEFTSAQRFDFEVRTTGGEEVWRWSADRAFAQAVGSERLEPEATWQERVQWVAGGRKGEYVAVGRLVATDHPVELSARVELGED